MELVRGALRLPPDEYALDDRLREIGYGAVGGLDLARDAGRRSRAFARRLTREMDGVAAGRRELCEVQARMRDWYDSLQRRHRRGGPWRHRAGADGGARHRDPA